MQRPVHIIPESLTAPNSPFEDFSQDGTSQTINWKHRRFRGEVTALRDVAQRGELAACKVPNCGLSFKHPRASETRERWSSFTFLYFWKKDGEATRWPSTLSPNAGLRFELWPCLHVSWGDAPMGRNSANSPEWRPEAPSADEGAVSVSRSLVHIVCKFLTPSNYQKV